MTKPRTTALRQQTVRRKNTVTRTSTEQSRTPEVAVEETTEAEQISIRKNLRLRRVGRTEQQTRESIV